MPIYEYRCASCGFQHEYLQRVSDPRLTDCPECGKCTFNKLVTAAGFQLKGSGWYATDFKNNDKKPQAGKDKDRGGAEKSAEKQAEKPAEGTSDKPSETKKDEPKSEAASRTGACPAST